MVLLIVAKGETSETTAKSGRRRAQLRLAPAPEGLPVETRGFDLRKILEGGIDLGLNRAFAQDLSAEGVNGANARLFQACEGLLEIPHFEFPIPSLRRYASLRPKLSQGPVQLLSQAQLQFAGGLAREGDGHHTLDGGESLPEHRHHPVHQLRRFARAGCRLDNQAFFKRAFNPVARGLVVRSIGERNYGRHRTRSSASSRSPGLSFTRLSS